jgi:hypothetical protein
MKSMVLALLVALASAPSLAGPPLVCWQVDTDGAPSLPWGDSSRTFAAMKADYDTARLPEDTLALLAPETPVLARMETLRRAALYAMRDPEEGERLLSSLVARTRQDGDALSWFDAGYLAAAWRQAQGAHEPAFWTRFLEITGLRQPPEDTLGELGAYECVRRALKLRGADPAMEYAAALITWYPRQASHEGHLSRAATGAAEGSALERNLLKHFGDRGRTLAELRTAR